MAQETLIRFGIFGALLVLFGLWEALLPRRPRRVSQGARWRTNLALVAIDSLALRLVALAVPLLAVGAAVDAAALHWGLLNQVALPVWLEFILALLALDFAIWAQHLVTHKVPLFWRFHRVHHADRDMDVTTGVRFHPVEIAASMLLKVGLVYALGPSALAVLVFEVLLNGTALFNHANLALPGGVDRALRLLLVTPDMHRIHHSDQRAEHDSNYGFSLSVWDRLFGTYRAIPAKGQDGMVVGLEWQDDQPQKLGWSLWLPFRRE
jgi:sterol desaturase/sphingolipid hydroxylase (fatty acid hydroxylase superfamily)